MNRRRWHNIQHIKHCDPVADLGSTEWEGGLYYTSKTFYLDKIIFDNLHNTNLCLIQS